MTEAREASLFKTKEEQTGITLYNTDDTRSDLSGPWRVRLLPLLLLLQVH